MKIKNILIIAIVLMPVISFSSAAKALPAHWYFSESETNFPEDINYYAVGEIPPRNIQNAMLFFKEITSFKQAQKIESLARNLAMDLPNDDRELKYQWALLAMHCQKIMSDMENKAREEKLQAENAELKRKMNRYQSIAQSTLSFIVINVPLKDLIPQAPGGPKEDDQLSMEKYISENHGK